MKEMYHIHRLDDNLRSLFYTGIKASDNDNNTPSVQATPGWTYTLRDAKKIKPHEALDVLDFVQDKSDTPRDDIFLVQRLSKFTVSKIYEVDFDRLNEIRGIEPIKILGVEARTVDQEMTLRDHYAASALSGLISRSVVMTTETITERAFEFADAMLKARDK